MSCLQVAVVKINIYILIFSRIIKYSEISLAKFSEIARFLPIFIGFDHSFIVWVAWKYVLLDVEFFHLEWLEIKKKVLQIC